VQHDLEGRPAHTQSHEIVTFHASSGGEAVRLCTEHKPSLIVLDLGLPDMDGFAVVSALRETPGLRRMPLLVYSALDVGSADQSRLRLGRTEFLTKSRCTLAEFEAHVVRLLETVTNKKYVSLNAA
jgi:CheY-like chemotaxis protein